MAGRRTLGEAPCHRDRGPGGDLRRLLRRRCGGGSAPARSISRWRRPGWRRRSRKISATATRSRSAARRSSGPGRIRIAVRIRDIVVRDRDHAIVASAPKAEVKLSGTALLMGRLRAESLNLVDAELAVRITPDGYVTVSAGDTAKPLATGVASKKRGRHCADLSASNSGAPPARRRFTALHRRRRERSRHDAKRTAGRPRLARQPEPDRARRTEPQRDRPEERQPGHRRSAARQQMDISKTSRLSLRRPSGGGVALSLGEEGSRAWSLRVVVGRSRERRAIGRHSRRQGLDRAISCWRCG